MFSKQGELDLARVLKALIDAGDIEPRPGFRGAGLVDHGPEGVRQGFAGTPEQKRKWYEKNKERILKEQKEKYHALPIEEKRKLPGYSKIGDPEELKKRSIRRRIRTLEKSPLSLDDLSRLDRFKLNIKYVKSLNDLYIEHGTRPSSEVISRELKSRLSNSDEFMDLWRKVHGNKPVQWANMSPSGFKNSYNQTMGATKKITTDNFKVALKDLMKVEFGDNLDDFIKNDFRLNETFLAQEKNTKNALYQKRYRAILQKSPVGEGWGPEGKKAWFADPDSGWSNKVTKLNKQLGVVDNDALKFVRAHFFPIFQAKKLNNLKLFSDSAKTNFFERFTYKPNYINRLQGKTYDEDIGKALMEYNTHKNKVKLAEDFKTAATKANKLGLDVDELILNKGGTFDFVDKGRKIQKGGSLGTRGPLLINAMEEIAEVQKIKPGMLGEKQMASIITDYGSEKGNKIIKQIKLGETSFYPKIPESAQRKKFVERPSKYIRKLPGGVRHFADIAARYGAKSPALLSALKKAKGAGKWTGLALAAEPAFAAPFAEYGYKMGESPERILGDATFGLFGETEQEELKKAVGERGYATQQIENYGSTLSALEEKYRTFNDQNDPRGEKRQRILNLYNNTRGKYNKAYDLFVDESGKFDEDLYEQGLNNYTAGLIQIDKFKKQKQAERIEQAGGYDNILQERKIRAIKGYARGGITNLTRTVAPDSGPMSQGLRSLYIDDMD